jgi:predicted lipid-binding transport protein (Tim44 family)
MRFNPPPNWPVPPGRTPGPNWTPDPSWGPPPPGWQFWVDDSADRTEVISRSASGGWTPTNYYPPPSFPQYQPQYQPPRKSPVPLILIGIAVGVVIAAVVAVVLILDSRSDKTASGSSGSSAVSASTSRSPESDEDQIRTAIRGIQSAYNNEDYTKFKSYLCSKRANDLSETDFKKDRSDEGRVTITVKSITVHGDTADAEVTIKTSNSTATSTVSGSPNGDAGNMEFVKENGEWRWC